MIFGLKFNFVDINCIQFRVCFLNRMFHNQNNGYLKNWKLWKVKIFKIKFDAQILHIFLMGKPPLVEFFAWNWQNYEYFSFWASEAPLYTKFQILMNLFD